MIVRGCGHVHPVGDHDRGLLDVVGVGRGRVVAAGVVRGFVGLVGVAHGRAALAGVVDAVRVVDVVGHHDHVRGHALDANARCVSRS